MAKRAKKEPKTEPKWRTVERVTALIEKIIDPGAEVKHDVHLPDLETPGYTRQCDVVITSGVEHRRTRTIVEVQRRGRKVEVAHFDGWVAKMRAVGAQHLICVSAAGYPRSVLDKAAKLGPTVRLVSLRELERSSPLLQGALGKRVLIEHHGTTSFPEIEFLTDQAGIAALSGQKATPMQHELAFRMSDGRAVSLNEIAQRMIANQPGLLRDLPPGEHKVALGVSEHVTYMYLENPVRVRVRLVAMVQIARLSIDCHVLEYRQIDGDGLIRWAQIGRVERPGTNTEYELTLVFNPGPDGRLVPETLNVLGAVPGDFLSARAGDLHVGPVFVMSPP